MSAQLPSYSDWIWSPEHRRYYCYRYTDDGRAEYMWSDATAQDQDRDQTRISRGASNPATAAASTTTTRGATSTPSENHHHHHHHYDDGGTHRPHKPPPPPSPSPPGSSDPHHSKDKEAPGRYRNPTTPMPPPPPPQQQQNQPPTADNRLRRGSAEDVRRFQDGDEASMAVEDEGGGGHGGHGGQMVRASFVVRRGRLDARGHRWEYQLWHEDGTAYDGGHWFREAELS